ncbi:O-acetylserine/cysteine efflux transporter [Cellulosimicrobium cellulans]|jgi:O-acetylserine/cysteine efflux transporter|uniref:EamA family transporter n=1 Tax=Cellulosimicrobium cellulans TaxID=1710 RepID=UPI001957ECD3|nr:EamA family transporter [Cellulosimicrobium cellulans]MBM7818473.1 O-acetylserine/cysteine efflux transporter [Cellulosimicrobium cellulans]
MPLRSSLLALLVAVVWGVNFVVIDLGLGDMPPTLFVALRFLVVLVPAIFLVPRPRARWRDVLLVGAFMSLGQFGLLYTALALGMPAGLASLVLQAQVGLTVLFAAATLREVPTRSQLVGVLVGAAGLVVVGVGRSASTPALAFVVTLAAAASWAVGNVVARRAGSRQALPSADQGSTSRRPGLEGLSMTVWSALVVPLPMLGLSLALDGPDAVGHALTHLTLAPVLSTLYTAWLASLVGYGIWNTLLARHPASAVVPFTMLVPPVGMLAAWVVLDEVPNAAELLGGVVLLLGVATTTGVLRRRPRHATSARPGSAEPGVAPHPPADLGSDPVLGSPEATRARSR